jgi:hypothetical protein
MKRLVLPLVVIATFLAWGAAASNAGKTPGCTADSTAHGHVTDTCTFIASGGTLNVKVSKFTAASRGAIEDEDPTCSIVLVTHILTANGASSITLNQPGDCVFVNAQGTGGKITASG